MRLNLAFYRLINRPTVGGVNVIAVLHAAAQLRVVCLHWSVYIIFACHVYNFVVPCLSLYKEKNCSMSGTSCKHVRVMKIPLHPTFI